MLRITAFADRLEEGLEGLIIDGRVTLLRVLEDVRPGDILEICYTIEHRPRLLNMIHFFCLSNYAILLGMLLYARGDRMATWETERPS